MSVSAGRLLGPYEIVAPLGAGGMGEVYRARDTRLGRQVAVKILPAAFAGDPERLRRFQQEATAAAALNDPGILAVYDVGSHDGVSYVVTELLEGETLRDRLSRGALSQRRSMEYAIQVARALTAAHDKEIVHRDLKPENLFITRDGRTKILDFGLAKLQRWPANLQPQEEGSTASGLTAAATIETTPGLVLGTVGYMSPEQVRGLPVDPRADIFALGAILYEMLSGQRAFKGQTPADTMSAILNDDPPELTESGRDISPALERIVSHCLAKNPEERFRSAHDVAFALENISQTSQSKLVMPPKKNASLMFALKLVLVCLALSALMGGFLAWRGTHQPVAAAFRRLTFERGMVLSARFVGDGKNVIYAASWESRPVRLYSTPSDAVQARPLELESASLLGVSRDGELALAIGGKISSHLVIRDATLARSPLAGGAPRELLEQVRAADWAPDGTLAVVHYVDGRCRLEYPVGKVLYETGGWISHMRVSPTGDHIAFMLHPSWPDDRGYVALVDRIGNEKNLTQEWEAEQGLAWSAKGDEIWFTATPTGADQTLYAITPSGKMRVVLRTPGELMLHDIATDGRVLLSRDADRVGMRGAREGGAERELTWMGWTIAEAISPDGKMVIFAEESEAAGNEYIVGMRNFDGSPPVRLGEGVSSGVSTNGRWAAARPADLRPQITLLPTGAGQPKKIDVPGLKRIASTRFFPDDKRLLVIGADNVNAAFRSYEVELATGKATPVTPEGVFSLVLSPDGTDVAASDLSGNLSIYSVTGNSLKTIPNTQGMQPVQWAADRHFLFTTVPDEMPGRLLRVNIENGQQELVRRLLPGDIGGVYSVWSVRATPDGKTYAYTYRQTVSTLYVVEGLR